MDKEELKNKRNILENIFHYGFDYESYQSEENLKKKTRSLILSFFYRVLNTNLIEKEFKFGGYYRDEMEKILQLNLCDLIDDAMIDLKHYLSYVKKYKDEDSIFYELEKINDDYFDIHKIPEFNSKKYIRKKVEHIGEIVSSLGKKLNIYVPDAMTVRFGKEDDYYSRYDNAIICTGHGLNDDYDLNNFWEYITPSATDKAILAKFELKLYLAEVKHIRIDILNSLTEFEYFLELDFLSLFFTDEEIKKLNEFNTFLIDFDAKHAELFGHEELGYKERRGSRW